MLMFNLRRVCLTRVLTSGVYKFTGRLSVTPAAQSPLHPQRHIASTFARSPAELFAKRLREMETEFDNGGVNQLHVPGFGVPIDYEMAREERFAHGLNDW